jgi:hypothetical protein
MEPEFYAMKTETLDEYRARFEPDTQLEMADGVPVDLREKWVLPGEKE